MMEHVEGAPRERDAALHHVIKTDPDPRVRRRAQALLWVAEGQSQARARACWRRRRIGSTSGSSALTLSVARDWWTDLVRAARMR
jgi:hypothetical protein